MESDGAKGSQEAIQKTKSAEQLDQRGSQKRSEEGDIGQTSDSRGGGDGEVKNGLSGTGTLASSSLKDVTSTYQVRPNLQDRFRPGAVNELIHEVLHEELTGKVYSTEESDELTTRIANIIRNRVKEMALSRYKYMVQVVLAEQRGAGIVMGMRCLWDAETDSYASNQFLSDTIYGMAAVFAVYFY